MVNTLGVFSPADNLSGGNPGEKFPKGTWSPPVLSEVFSSFSTAVRSDKRERSLQETFLPDSHTRHPSPGTEYSLLRALLLPLSPNSARIIDIPTFLDYTRYMVDHIQKSFAKYEGQGLQKTDIAYIRQKPTKDSSLGQPMIKQSKYIR